MIAAIIALVSVVAFSQFGLYYWRATITGVAAQAVSDRILVAAGITHAVISAEDFRNIIILKDLSPDLRGPNGSFRGIRTYYAVVQTAGQDRSCDGQLGERRNDNLLALRRGSDGPAPGTQHGLRRASAGGITDNYLCFSYLQESRASRSSAAAPHRKCSPHQRQRVTRGPPF